jgi:hypothetical protein
MKILFTLASILLIVFLFILILNKLYHKMINKNTNINYIPDFEHTPDPPEPEENPYNIRLIAKLVEDISIKTNIDNSEIKSWEGIVSRLKRIDEKLGNTQSIGRTIRNNHNDNKGTNTPS